MKTRSSPSVSSTSGKPHNKPLELVREETEDDEEQVEKSPATAFNQFDLNDNDDECEFNDDFQMELVVDGILKFFATFVEKIFVKKSSNNIETSARIVDYYRRVMLRNVPNDEKDVQQKIDRFLINCQQSHYPEMVINCQLFPLYQLFCELLIEIGTIPLLSSPAFLFKKREQKNTLTVTQFIADSKQQKQEEVISDSVIDTVDNIRWFIYLMALSLNGIGSCTHCHPDHHDERKAMLCCQLRHVSYTSLATILDLMTMTRAYIVSQPSMYPTALSFGDGEFPMPSYVDMTIIDLFPRTFVARRLNFFPLIHPKMLKFVYESTTWFRMVASGLWSNLSARDSVLHHSTSALLQQLHSISHDESICEVVICDDMIGNNGAACMKTTTTMMNNDGCMDSLRFFHPQHQLSFEQQSRQMANNMDIIHRARTKFALMFAIIRDIRFISERLALVVNALASAARSASSADSDVGLMNTVASGYGDSDLLTVNENSSSSKLIAQLEMEIATGMDSSHYQSLMNVAMIYLHRLLRITCPISPIALCSTLKRHFDRPLFIMLDALSQRRNLSDQYSISADWLLRCVKQPNLFGTKNLMFTSPNGFGVTSEFHNHHFDDSDISRILEPLLFILLHPNTARLSIKNVNILRYTRTNHNNDLMANYSKKQQIEQIDSTESKIYAITSTNGNVIYHVRRRPPSRSPTSASTTTFNASSPMFDALKTNPFENSSIHHDSDSIQIQQIVDDLMNRIASEMDQDVDIDEFIVTKKFPGMASFQSYDVDDDDDDQNSPSTTNATGNDFSTDRKYRSGNDDHSNGRKLRFAEMHQHLLLYERRYDSLRTTYALDTIISMIETWPSRVLYAMSTSSLFNGSIMANAPTTITTSTSSPYVNSGNIPQSLSSVFDGSRSAQIKTLYQRHRSSIHGDGFYPNHNGESLVQQPNTVVNNNVNPVVTTASGTNRTRSRSRQHVFESTPPPSSADENITLLELIIQIC
ncbi:hypothetical protein BLA29_001736, partial [Euroglyphus maynei]